MLIVIFDFDYAFSNLAVIAPPISPSVAQSPWTLPTVKTGTAASGASPLLAGVGPKNRQNH